MLEEEDESLGGKGHLEEGEEEEEGEVEEIPWHNHFL